MSGFIQVAEKFASIKRMVSSRPYEKHVVPQYYAVDNSLGTLGDSTVSTHISYMPNYTEMSFELVGFS